MQDNTDVALESEEKKKAKRCLIKSCLIKCLRSFVKEGRGKNICERRRGQKNTRRYYNEVEDANSRISDEQENIFIPCVKLSKSYI